MSLQEMIERDGLTDIMRELASPEAVSSNYEQAMMMSHAIKIKTGRELAELAKTSWERAEKNGFSDILSKLGVNGSNGNTSTAKSVTPPQVDKEVSFGAPETKITQFYVNKNNVYKSSIGYVNIKRNENQYLNFNIFNLLCIYDNENSDCFYKMYDFESETDDKPATSNSNKTKTEAKKITSRQKLVARVERIFERDVVRKGQFDLFALCELMKSSLKNKAWRDALRSVLKKNYDLDLLSDGRVVDSQFCILVDLFLDIEKFDVKTRANMAYTIASRTPEIKKRFDDLKKCILCHVHQCLNVYPDSENLGFLKNLVDCKLITSNDGAASVMADNHNKEMHTTNGNIDSKWCVKKDEEFNQLFEHKNTHIGQSGALKVNSNLDMFETVDVGHGTRSSRMMLDFPMMQMADTLVTDTSGNNEHMCHGANLNYSAQTSEHVRGVEVVLSGVSTTFITSDPGDKEMFAGAERAKKINNIFSPENYTQNSAFLRFLSDAGCQNTLSTAYKKWMGYYLSLSQAPTSASAHDSIDVVYNDASPPLVDSLFYPLYNYNTSLPKVEAISVDYRLFVSWFTGRQNLNCGWTVDHYYAGELAIIPVDRKLLTENKNILLYTLGFLEYPFHNIKYVRKQMSRDNVGTNNEDVYCTPVSSKMRINGPRHKIMYVFTFPTQSNQTMRVYTEGIDVELPTMFIDAKGEIKNQHPAIDMCDVLSDALRKTNANSFRTIMVRLSELGYYDQPQFNEDLKWWSIYGVLLPQKSMGYVGTTTEPVDLPKATLRREEAMNKNRALLRAIMRDNVRALHNNPVTREIDIDEEVPLDLWYLLDPQKQLEGGSGSYMSSMIRGMYLNHSLTKAAPCKIGLMHSQLKGRQGKYITDADYEEHLAISDGFKASFDEDQGYVFDLREIDAEHLSLLVFYKLKLPYRSDVLSLLTNFLINHPSGFCYISRHILYMYTIILYMRIVPAMQDDLWFGLHKLTQEYVDKKLADEEINVCIVGAVDSAYAMGEGNWLPWTSILPNLYNASQPDHILSRSKSDLEKVTTIEQYKEVYGIEHEDVFYDIDALKDSMNASEHIWFLMLQMLPKSIMGLGSATGGKPDKGDVYRAFVKCYNEAFNLIREKYAPAKNLLKTSEIESILTYSGLQKIEKCSIDNVMLNNKVANAQQVRKENRRIKQILSISQEFKFTKVDITNNIGYTRTKNVYNIDNSSHINNIVNNNIPNSFVFDLIDYLDKRFERLEKKEMSLADRYLGKHLTRTKDTVDDNVSMASSKSTAKDKDKSKTTSKKSKILKAASLLRSVLTPSETYVTASETDNTGGDKDPAANKDGATKKTNKDDDINSTLATITDQLEGLQQSLLGGELAGGKALTLEEKMARFNESINKAADPSYNPVSPNLNQEEESDDDEFAGMHPSSRMPKLCDKVLVYKVPKYDRPLLMNSEHSTTYPAVSALITSDTKIVSSARLVSNGVLQTPLFVEEVWDGKYHTMIPSIDGASLVAIMCGFCLPGTTGGVVKSDNWVKKIYKMALNRAQVIDATLNYTGTSQRILRRYEKHSDVEQEAFERFLGVDHAYTAAPYGDKEDLVKFVRDAWKLEKQCFSYYCNDRNDWSMYNVPLHDSPMLRTTLTVPGLVNNNGEADLDDECGDVIEFENLQGDCFLASKRNDSSGFLKLSRNVFTMRNDQGCFDKVGRYRMGVRGVQLPLLKPVVLRNSFGLKRECVVNDHLIVKEDFASVYLYANPLVHDLRIGIPTQLKMQASFVNNEITGKFADGLFYFNDLKNVATSVSERSRQFVFDFRHISGKVVKEVIEEKKDDAKEVEKPKFDEKIEATLSKGSEPVPATGAVFA